MSIFHVLYKSYLKAEETGLVDSPKLDDTGRNIVILPIYHMNLCSNGNNVAQVILDEEGLPIRLTFLEKDVYTIFPITEGSLNRTSNEFAHPLCDDMQYLSKGLNITKYTHYCEQNKEWLAGVSAELNNSNDETAEDINIFLEQIRELVLNEDILMVVKSLMARQYKVLSQTETSIEVELKPETEGSKVKKKYDLSKVFITFAKQFSDAKKQDLDITTNQLLHQAHIRYTQKIQARQADMLDFCDVSGQKMYCTNRNRGLLGKAKLISISNNEETYRGRLKEGPEVIRIGADTSEKIHLMLKFFLEHRDNAQSLYNNTTAVIWFAEDLLNEREFSLEDPTMEDDFWNNLVEEYQIESLADERTRDWKKILRGERTLFEAEKDDFFYLMMINKISNGRIAIQSSRTIPIMTFLRNLQHWKRTCTWEFWHPKKKEYEDKTPKPWDIIRFVYGIERDGKVDCLKNELKSAAFKRLLPSIIDGFPLAKDMARQIFSNYKNRIAYKKNWRYLQYMSCALLNKVRQDQGKEKRLAMLEKDKQTRDYLYGRLLAIYEKVEMDAMTPVSFDKKSEDKGNSLRITNVEKMWAAFFQTPERMLETLHMKIRPYLDKLKANQAGRYRYYNKLIGEIQTDIRDAETYLANKNKALNEDAVFGYYAQNKDFYLPRTEIKENENA